MTGLNTVLGAAHTGSLPKSWLEAEVRLASERDQIEELLTSPDQTPIYGFTTLLGQLDSHTATTGYQSRLLDAHLIGRQCRAPAGLLRWATLAKLAQLSIGGSGVSPKTYQQLLSRAYDDPRVDGAWWDSYGSGDVVPAAWWLVAVLGESAVHTFAKGDLIALINGNFFSTGAALLAFDELRSVQAEILVRAASVAQPPILRTEASDDLVASLAEVRPRFAQTDEGGPTVQLPVSLRDYGPLVSAAQRTITALSDSLDVRLSGPSANPLFTFSHGSVRAHSQSSFLDAGLTMALDASSTGVAFLLCALQRYAEHVSAFGLKLDPERVEFVQPPKVSMSVLQQALAEAQSTSVVALSESGGVEDLADGSLRAARSLLNLLARAREMLALFDSMANPGDPGTHRAVGNARSALGVSEFGF